MFRNFLLIVLVAIAALQASRSLAQMTDEYKLEVDRLNQRYEDFFLHDQAKQRYADQVKAGIPDQKKVRQQEAAEKEAARLEQLRVRKPKADDSALEAQHEAGKKEEARKFDIIRQQYVEERAALRKIRESARKIPENRDAGLVE